MIRFQINFPIDKPNFIMPLLLPGKWSFGDNSKHNIMDDNYCKNTIIYDTLGIIISRLTLQSVQ